MKSLLFSLIFLPACVGNKLTPKIFANDIKNVALAGGMGYLQGGKAGAVIGMTVAEAANLKRLTSAKNPKKVTP